MKSLKRPLVKYGTYGFLSMMLASQLSMAATSTSEKVDRAALDAKKSGRSVKRDLKKTGRKLTGQDSAFKDMKDEVKDGVKNTKDEVHHASKHSRVKKGE